MLDPGKALQTYVGVFEMIGMWGLLLGGLLILLSPILRYLAHERRAGEGARQPAE